jgi:hypothetical protein
MNDIYIDTYNPIFETLHEFYTKQQHTSPRHVMEAAIRHIECP